MFYFFYTSAHKLWGWKNILIATRLTFNSDFQQYAENVESHVFHFWHWFVKQLNSIPQKCGRLSECPKVQWTLVRQFFYFYLCNTMCQARRKSLGLWVANMLHGGVLCLHNATSSPSPDRHWEIYQLCGRAIYRAIYCGHGTVWQALIWWQSATETWFCLPWGHGAQYMAQRLWQLCRHYNPLQWYKSIRGKMGFCYMLRGWWIHPVSKQEIEIISDINYRICATFSDTVGGVWFL